ncbi:MAG: trypsin-like peptidase domain-containing protein [Aeromicrobium sp.]
MTDSHDPFAANPYTPPSERDDSGTALNPADTSPHEAPEAPQPDAEPTVEVRPADAEPTVEVPAAAAWSSPTPPAPPAAPADDFTHRYPTAGDPVAAPLHDHDDPFRANEPTAVAAPPRRRGRKLAGAVAFLLLAGGVGYGGAALHDELQNDGDGNGAVVSSLESGNTAEQTSLPAGTVEQVAAKVLPSVVQINVKGGQESGSGTGIIISSDGNILTNNHVVDVASDGGTITVAFNDGTNTTAEIVGTDPKTDLAVIKAEGKTGLTAATLGTSADLKVGQEVVAIGSPFGLESTVTQGIVSALNRPVSSSDGSGTGQPTTFPAVQTDAAINPGNSGGPLVDLDGNVIAINSAIRSGTTTSGDAGSIGLGFAIPVDLAKNVSKQLLEGKTVEHAQIGVSVDNFLGTDGITGIGAEVKELTPNGAGEEAGLKEGDVITAVNDNLIPTSEALVAAVRGFNPGEKVTLTYTRNGEKAQVEVTLGSDGGTTE